MIAKECGFGMRLFGLALIGVLIPAGCPALAQQDAQQRFSVPPPAPRTAPEVSSSKARPKHLSEIDVQPLVAKPIPFNPGDPIAIVNNQIISRQQLADECVARKGKEILDLLVNRTLIDQALRAKKLEVTAAEIDQEIELVAGRFRVSREHWLRTLDKERGISPIQYARDIIYPGLALRKLCAGRVQVTPEDLKKAFEARYGDKLKCRMIYVEKQSTAVEIWEELRKNPGGFEKLAQERSKDPGSASLGGLLAEPITRHAIPENLSDAAFRQLVDGDPKDRDPSHKPKDGDFTGPIQIAEMAWVILRRESIIPAVEGADLKNETVRKQTYELIYEVKLKETMGLVFQELVKGAAIENRLTGNVKLAHEDKDPDYGVDRDVKLMGGPPGGKDADARSTAAAAAGAVSRTKLPPPAALSPEAAQQFDKLNRPLKGGTNTPAQSNPASPN
jgi:foldase protein PrsA